MGKNAKELIASCLVPIAYCLLPNACVQTPKHPIANGRAAVVHRPGRKKNFPGSR